MATPRMASSSTILLFLSVGLKLIEAEPWKAKNSAVDMVAGFGGKGRSE